MTRLLASSFFAGLGFAVALFAVVFASGATFGQRCSRVYHDERSVSNCVDRLSNGGKL